MQFLFSHWHCIVPVVGIGIAFFFLWEKPKEKKTNQQNDAAAMSQQDNRE